MAEPEILAQAIDEYADALERHRSTLAGELADLDAAFRYLVGAWRGQGADDFQRNWQAATAGLDEQLRTLPGLQTQLRQRARLLRAL